MLVESGVPPVTTATRPSTSYKSCVLYLEAIVDEIEWMFLEEARLKGQDEKCQWVARIDSVYTFRYEIFDVSKESICNVT